MRRVHLAAIAGAMVLAAAALSACGSSDDNSADEDQITAAIDRAATSGDPAACTDAQTQKFNEQTSGGGGDATKQCEKDAADAPADKVDVTNIEVNGDTATADAAVTGSVFDGQTLQLALVKEGDQWKLDQFTGFAHFDRAALGESLSAEIGKDPHSPPKAADCVKARVETLSDQEAQDVFLSSDNSAGDKLFGPCFPGE
jgi:hypothetical protein